MTTPNRERPMRDTLDAPTISTGSPLAASAARDRSSLALSLLGAAAGFGLLADVLLRGDGLGINAPILVLALVTAALLLLRARGGVVAREAAGAGAAAIIFAAMFAWRDSEMLGLLNFVAVIGSLALLAFAAARAPLANLRFGTVGEYAFAVVRSAADAIAGVVLLVLRDLDLPALSARTRGRGLGRVALGFLLALPLLVVFGALFASADAAFEAIVGDIVRFDIGVVVSHVVVTGIFAWLACGWLRGAALVARDPEIRGARLAMLGVTEVAIVLGLLDLLFALFVGVQLRYWFGGEALVQATAGMTYAEYARRGFFELCWASALVLPVLLGSRAVLRVDQERDARIHRVLSLVLVGLVMVVMASALARLRLYVAAYGWTVDRLFAIAAVGWLATVFVWYVATVLRRRVRGFAFGALTSGALVLTQLNLLDPDAWVVDRNRELALSGARTLDPKYGTSLSADAVPAYLPTLRLLEEENGCRAAHALLNRWDVEGEDWRSWNLSRARARAAVRAARPWLHRMAAAPACTAPARAPGAAAPGPDAMRGGS
jgi:hypothetical protein